MGVKSVQDFAYVDEIMITVFVKKDVKPGVMFVVNYGHLNTELVFDFVVIKSNRLLMNKKWKKLHKICWLVGTQKRSNNLITFSSKL